MTNLIYAFAFALTVNTAFAIDLADSDNASLIALGTVASEFQSIDEDFDLLSQEVNIQFASGLARTCQAILEESKLGNREDLKDMKKIHALAGDLSKRALTAFLGKLHTYELDASVDYKDISDILKCILRFKDRHGKLPGVTHIVLAEIKEIANPRELNRINEICDKMSFSVYEQEAQRFEYNDQDVAIYLSKIENTSPLNIISLQNIKDNCIINNRFSLYASLLKPFMNMNVSDAIRPKVIQKDFKSIKDFMNADIKSILPEERIRLLQLLNIVVLFKNNLINNLDATDLSYDLAKELYEKIQSKHLSSEQAAIFLLSKWEEDNMLTEAMDLSIATIENKGFECYA